MELLALIGGYVVVALIGIIGLLILYMIVRGRINLEKLLAEENGDASFSRFQFFIFTFVIAMCVLVLTLESGHFPEISGEILGLLGISGGSYVVAKGIELNAPDKPQ